MLNEIEIPTDRNIHREVIAKLSKYIYFEIEIKKKMYEKKCILAFSKGNIEKGALLPDSPGGIGRGGETGAADVVYVPFRNLVSSLASSPYCVYICNVAVV